MQKRRKGNPNWHKGMASPNPTGGTSRADSSSTLQESINRRLDAWMNERTGLGVVGRDKAMSTGFEMDLVDADSGQCLWRGDPIGARLVEVPPNECTRQGWELCIGDDELPDTYKPEPQANPIASAAAQATAQTAKAPPKAAARADHAARAAFAKKHPSAFARITRRAIARMRMDAGEAKPLQEKVSKMMDGIQASQIIRECMCYERAGGGSAAIIGANDFATDLRVPLDLKKVRSLDYLTPLEAREIIPLYYYNDPFKPKFGQPAIYQLVPFVIGAPVDTSYAARVTQIHETRLLIFPGIRTTRRTMMTSMNGWGDNIFTRAVRALRSFNVGVQSAETMLHDFALAIYKIKGLAKLIAENPNALTDSMMAVDLGKSICNAVVLDSEEDFERKSTSLAGYADVLKSLQENLAAVADMPLTLLMGVSPAGMNATGASDIRFFYDRIASMQTQRVAPLVMRLVEIALATLGEDPDKVNHSIRFKPLWQPTEKEIAEARYIQAQADALYITNEVASPEEIALSRFGGDEYSFETYVDFEARAGQEAIVAPAVDAKPVAPPPISPNGTPLPPAATEPPKVEPIATPA